MHSRTFDVNLSGYQMTGRFKHLDGLRGVAALIVLLSHSLITFDFALYTGKPTDSITAWDVWLSGAPFQIPIAANLAVCLFFAMSGFVLIGAFDASKMGPIRLLTKRYIRLALPISAACLVSYFALRTGLMANHQAASVTRSFWLDVQFQQVPSLAGALRESAEALRWNFGMAQSYDSSLWTMPIEFGGSVGVISICFAAKFIKSRDTRRACYIALLSVLYLIFAQSYLGLFAAGALIRMAIPHGWQWLARRPQLAIGLCFIGLFLGTIPESSAAWRLFSAFPKPHAPGWMPWPADGPTFWHTVGAIVALIGMQSSQAIQRTLLTPACQWLGSVSFPLYLVHIPILLSIGCRVFLAAQGLGARYALSVALGSLVSITVALLSAHVFTIIVERRAIRYSDALARLRLPRRLVAPATAA